jgi:hypothetical protein
MLNILMEKTNIYINDRQMRRTQKYIKDCKEEGIRGRDSKKQSDKNKQ